MDIKQEINDEINRLKSRWSLFASHRFHVSDTLCALAPVKKSSLAVFGAGACCDIDLLKLLSRYEQIALIDGNGQALDNAAKLHKDIDFERVGLYGNIDFTGLHNIFSNWKEHKPDSLALEEAMKIAANHELPELGKKFDVSVSDCVLSQIIDQAVQAMGERHPQLLNMIIKLRNKHLELLLDHVLPGGHAVLITDMASSVDVPLLDKVDENSLTDVMEKLIAEKRFVTGCNPYAIVSGFQKNAVLAGKVQNIQLLCPWIWNLSKDVKQLVCCLIFQKK